MSSSGCTDGGTASLFPDAESAIQTTGADLRKAAPLLPVHAQTSRDLEDTSYATDLRTGDLFAWGARQRHVELKGSVSGARAATRQGVLQGPSKGRAGRLTRCLDGGGWDRTLPGERGRRVRRNRILFLLLFGALALFMIARMVFGR